MTGFSFLRHSSNWIRHHNSSVIDAGSSPAWRARFKGSVLNESLSSSNYGESAVIKPIEFETFTPALVGLFYWRIKMDGYGISDGFGIG